LPSMISLKSRGKTQLQGFNRQINQCVDR